MEMKTVLFSAVLVAVTGVVSLAQQPSTPSAENGKKLFLRDGCWECHGYAGQGGRDGARLAETALTTAQFTRYIRRPTGAMPAYIEKVLSDAEAADIWAYVKAMTGPKTAKEVPLLTELKGQ
jgi:mono/diheme cytochrome c family protein